MDGRTTDGTDGLTDGLTDGRTDGRTDGQTDGRLRMDGRITDGWMDDGWGLVWCNVINKSNNEPVS